MKKKTIWLENIQFEKPKTIDKNIDVDVLIIGGGITGLSTAYHLINSKLNVCVVEKDIIANGVSARTTGKLTYLQEKIYTKLKSKAKQYYESQKEAIDIVENIINENKIDCNYEKVTSYLFTDKASEINTIKDEEKYLKKCKIKVKRHYELPLDIKCKYAISVNDTAVFHPVKYLIELKKIIANSGISVYEKSRVTAIEKENDTYKCKVNEYTITANKVVFATHYPFFLFPMLIPLKTHVEKSYISAIQVSKTKKFSAITITKPTKSIRYHEDKNKYMFFLNGTHDICNKLNNKKNFDELIKEVDKNNLKLSYMWSNQDVMTSDSLPYIGYVEKNLLIGTGYNTWGMTNGSLAGKVLSDLIQNKENKYQELFDPKRNIKLTNMIKYSIYMSKNIKAYLQTKVNKNKSWYKNKVKFTNLNGKAVGIYTDENNKKHIVYNLCPHMKCSLIFNEVEKTWDCPCHGSKYDMDGKYIFGPTKEDINYKP